MIDLNQLTQMAIQEIATTPTAVTTVTGQTLSDLRSNDRPKTTQTGVALFKDTITSKAGKVWYIYEFKSIMGTWFKMMSQKDLGNQPIQYSNQIFGLGFSDTTKDGVTTKTATLFL